MPNRTEYIKHPLLLQVIEIRNTSLIYLKLRRAYTGLENNDLYVLGRQKFLF